MNSPQLICLHVNKSINSQQSNAFRDVQMWRTEAVLCVLRMQLCKTDRCLLTFISYHPDHCIWTRLSDHQHSHNPLCSLILNREQESTFCGSYLKFTMVTVTLQRSFCSFPPARFARATVEFAHRISTISFSVLRG